MHVETFVVPPRESNAYLVYGDGAKEAVLIDPARSAAKVLPRLESLGIALAFILNTHGHPGHVADNAAIAKATRAKVAVHEADAYRLENPDADAHTHLPAPPPPSKADVVLKEASVVEAGPVRLRVVHTPGHTQGSSCFYAEAEGTLFTGDTLLAGRFGDTSGLGSSPAFLWQSLRKLYALPPQTRVFPGHGRATRIGDESWIANLRYAAPH